MLVDGTLQQLHAPIKGNTFSERITVWDRQVVNVCKRNTINQYTLFTQTIHRAGATPIRRIRELIRAYSHATT